MINDLKQFFESKKIFSLDKQRKKILFSKYFKNLTNYHYKKCIEYKNICKNLNYKTKNNFKLETLPYLPVNIFKSLNLKSIKNHQITRVMRSSGTTSNNYSKIYLDKINSKNQIKALNELFIEVTGSSERLPMLVIDSKSILRKKDSFSARSAAILGFSLFAKEITYALKDDMTVDFNAVNEFFIKNKDKQNIIFGFTYLIWQNLLENIKLKNRFKFNNSILIHGGGWKKLKEKKISNTKFKKLLLSNFNIRKVINYYGMVEQTGSIFFESEKCNYFHTSIFSDVFIRDKEFNNIGFNKKGMLQLLSVLPTSYPGHNILTEDTGMILGEDNCKCGKKGKYFKVFDRLEKAEIRGCGDAISK